MGKMIAATPDLMRDALREMTIAFRDLSQRTLKGTIAGDCADRMVETANLMVIAAGGEPIGTSVSGFASLSLGDSSQPPRTFRSNEERQDFDARR